MKRVYDVLLVLFIVLLIVWLFSGCAAPQPKTVEEAQCDLQADIATASIRSPVARGMEWADLYQKCLRLSRMKRS